MKIKIHLPSLQVTEEKPSIEEALEKAKETCRDCRPLTPITCATRCDIWKQKNELAKLSRKMKDPNFMPDLLNTLKNQRRLYLLKILSNGKYSIIKLQQELKKLGYHHSRGTISKEYINPLRKTGLIEEHENKYRATLFGHRLEELLYDSSDVVELLHPHSKCYEEKTIEALSESPKTYAELESLIATESLSRVLKRLQKKNLITKDNENSYIFYFKTKRELKQEKVSPTEKRVYKNIPEEGITAQKLANKTNISLRRTYKYLRKLRGKKLVFKRTCPKTYTLTAEGAQIARLLGKMQGLLVDLAHTLTELTQNSNNRATGLGAGHN